MRRVIWIVFMSLLVGGAAPALAADFTSTHFINRDPVFSISGGRSTSTNFELISGTGQVVIGEISSSTFTQRSGFFYFPSVTTPVVAATAGNAQVALSWTSAVGTLGFNVTTYEVGQATVSGGAYTFTNVGNVLSSTRTGLSNGTIYYFVIRALDFYGNVIVTSAEVSGTPVAPVVPPVVPPVTPPSGGGGGGGGPPPSVITAVNFSGWAYPQSSVTLLKDAQVVATTIAGPDAKFQIYLSNLSAGIYIFSLYSEDDAGRRSSLLTFPVSITAGATTNVSGIFLAPTIAVDKSEVRRGDNIAIFGQSIPKAEIVISVNSDQEFFAKTDANPSGVYLYNFDTSPLEFGSHLTKSKAAYKGEISSFSSAVGFSVGQKTVTAKAPKCPAKADLNSDCKVNLIDFSIAAFWYKRTLSPAFAVIEKSKLNGDGKIDLVDFSIMAYYWTG